MSRWRESSGVSFGSQIVPPGVSSWGTPAKAHEVLEVGVRRLAPLQPLADERAAVDGAERHVPAADVQRALGLRACRSNSRGAFATCSRIQSGSN